MPLPSRKTSRRVKQLARATIASTAALCVLVGMTYFPLPGVVQKDYNVPFPCMDKPCDCRNADDCWASCCCHSDDEKLAWAQKNGVSPPEWFLDGVRRTIQKPLAKASGSCCDANQPTCCQSRTPSESNASCCANKPARVDSRSSKVETNGKTQPIAVCIKQQRKCQGDDGVFHVDLLFVELTEPSVLPDRSKPAYRMFDIQSRSVAIPPPTPPPKCV